MKTAEAIMGVHLTDEQRLDWLRLIRSDNVGPRGLRAQLHQRSASYRSFRGVC